MGQWGEGGWEQKLEWSWGGGGKEVNSEELHSAARKLCLFLIIGPLRGIPYMPETSITEGR